MTLTPVTLTYDLCDFENNPKLSYVPECACIQAADPGGASYLILLAPGSPTSPSGGGGGP